MAKYTYRSNDGRVEIQFDADTQTAAFEEMAHFDEVFGSLSCEKDGVTSDDVKFQVRSDSDDNKYYELICVDGGKEEVRFAKKRFGVTKKGGYLFPKPLQNEEGKAVWKDGKRVDWVKYDSESKKEY